MIKWINMLLHIDGNNVLEIIILLLWDKKSCLNMATIFKAFKYWIKNGHKWKKHVTKYFPSLGCKNSPQRKMF